MSFKVYTTHKHPKEENKNQAIGNKATYLCMNAYVCTMRDARIYL